MWCIGELTPEYIERMEDVLNLYQKTYREKEPVICFDERPVQLLEDARPSLPARPGKVMKQDYEYIRCGTCNVFCGVEPKAGRHFTKVTKNRKGPEFAKVMEKLARSYPEAKTIHLVLDNLSTHTEKSLTDYYGQKQGEEIWGRFTIHYTPKHGSWLNQAEIEIGLFSRQCMGKDRIGSRQQLRERATAWNRSVNRKKIKIDWGFTIKKAQEVFKYKKFKYNVSQH